MATWIASSSQTKPGMVDLSYQSVSATPAPTIPVPNPVTTTASQMNKIDGSTMPDFEIPATSLNPFVWASDLGTQPTF